MAPSKKRVIKSLENISDDLRELMKRLYPNGYESAITRIKNAKNEPIFVFPLETDDSVYLIKVPATKNSEGEYDVESGTPQEFDTQAESSDDSFSNDDDYGNDNGGDDDYDEDGGGRKGGREASYDPDFDD
jgi:hypothetical protein